MNFYATFSIPFIVGVVTMFVVLIVKYGSWIFGLSAADRMRIVKGIPSRQTPLAVWEVVRESLLHRRIFKVNPLLGYMHMSLAFGWFLLIVVGWIETVAYLGFRYVPLHGHVFFKYFATELPHKPVFDFLMDLLLLFVLSGVTLAESQRHARKYEQQQQIHQEIEDRLVRQFRGEIFEKDMPMQRNVPEPQVGDRFDPSDDDQQEPSEGQAHVHIAQQGIDLEDAAVQQRFAHHFPDRQWRLPRRNALDDPHAVGSRKTEDPGAVFRRSERRTSSRRPR